MDTEHAKQAWSVWKYSRVINFSFGKEIEKGGRDGEAAQEENKCLVKGGGHQIKDSPMQPHKLESHTRDHILDYL